MKKKLIFLTAIFLAFILLGCEGNVSTTVISINDNTENSVTDRSTVTSAYEGPYFQSISMIYKMPDDLDNHENNNLNFIFRNQILSKMNLTLSNYSKPKAKLLSSTYQGESRVLVITLTQPASAEDYYVIQSVTITDPTGEQHKYTATNETYTFQTSSDYTKIYVPVTMPTGDNYFGNLTYTVDAIQYLDGSTIRDVRFGENSQNYIEINVDFRPITTNTYQEMVAGAYLYSSEQSKEDRLALFAIDNPDKLLLEGLYYGDTLLYSFNDSYIDLSNSFILPLSSIQNNSILTDNLIDSSGGNWIELTLKYYGIDSQIHQINFIVTTYTSPSYNVKIYTGEQLASLPRDFYGQIEIMNDITIPESWTPFTSIYFNLYTNNDVIYNIIYNNGDLLLFNISDNQIGYPDTDNPEKIAGHIDLSNLNFNCNVVIDYNYDDSIVYFCTNNTTFSSEVYNFIINGKDPEHSNIKVIIY